MLAALEEIFEDFEKGVDFLADLLHSHGKVIPVALTKTKLFAKTEDGKTINGEKNIDIPKTIDRSPIKKVWLNPVPHANSKAIKAIREAEAIIIGPGDLFTSLVPNLLVKGLVKALKKSKGKIIYITNLMTKNGETDAYKASDLINELEKYLGEKILDAVIINDKKISKKLSQKYKKEHSEQVVFDEENLQKVPYKIYPANLITTKAGLIRHDSERLARHILSIVLSLNGTH
jgi:uncharacterized cofD-like protein